MTRIAELERARLVLWERLDAGGESAAALVRELRAVVRELDELAADNAGEVPTVDEIAARRQARLSDAGDSAPAARRGQSRRRG